MSITARVDVIERDLVFALAPELTPAGQSRELARLARATRDEALVENERVLGRRPEVETFVDGRPGAPEETVKVPGRIVYEFDVGNDVIAYVWTEILKHSPVLTGRYRNSHRLFADGVEMTEPNPSLAAEEWVVLNAQPYSRKIERGLSDQAPDGAYQAVAVIAARRFGNVARFRFTYRTPLGVTPFRDRREERASRQPALVITFR